MTIPEPQQADPADPVKRLEELLETFSHEAGLCWEQQYLGRTKEAETRAYARRREAREAVVAHFKAHCK